MATPWTRSEKVAILRKFALTCTVICPDFGSSDCWLLLPCKLVLVMLDDILEARIVEDMIVLFPLDNSSGFGFLDVGSSSKDPFNDMSFGSLKGNPFVGGALAASGVEGSSDGVEGSSDDAEELAAERLPWLLEGVEGFG